MIDRERIEDVLERNKDGFPVLSVDELDELCRVYLAWLDAPVAEVDDYFGSPVIDGDFYELIGKRVRICSIGEENGSQ